MRFVNNQIIERSTEFTAKSNEVLGVDLVVALRRLTKPDGSPIILVVRTTRHRIPHQSTDHPPPFRHLPQQFPSIPNWKPISCLLSFLNRSNLTRNIMRLLSSVLVSSLLTATSLATSLTFKLAAHDKSCYFADVTNKGAKLAFYFAVCLFSCCPLLLCSS
jgi:hypothetical protein